MSRSRAADAHWSEFLALPLVAFASVCFAALLAALARAALGADGEVTSFELRAGLAGHGAAFVTTAFLCGAGDLALRAIGRAPTAADGFEGWLLRFAAGFALATALFMALAWAGLLSFASLGVAALAVAAAHAPRARMLAPWLARTIAPWRDPEAPRVLAAAGIAAGALLLAPVFVQSLLPNSDWDSALYQLPLAERYLRGAIFERDLLFEAYSFPGAVNLLYALWMDAGLESAVIPLNLHASAGLVAVAAALARRLAAPGEAARASGWAAGVLASCPIVWELGLDPRIDGVLALFVAIACLGLVAAVQDPERAERSWLLLGLGCGAALGIKYTGLFFAGAIGLLGAGLWLWRGRAGGTRTAALVTAVALLPNLAWYAANLQDYGDPLYPMLGGFYYEAADGERHTTATDLAPILASLPADSDERTLQRQLEGMPTLAARPHLFAPLELFLAPELYSVKPLHTASPLLLLFFGLGLRLRGARALERRVLFGLGLLLFGALGSRTHLLRYVLPVLPLFAAGAGCFLATGRTRLWQRGWTLLLAVSLLGGGAAEALKLAGRHPGPVLSGEWSRLDWLSEVGYNGQPEMPRFIAHTNGEIARGRISPEARILMIGEGKGRLLACDYLPDATWYQRRWLVALARADFDPDRAARQLHAEGVTHLLYNAEYMNWVLQNVPPRDAPRDQLAFAMVRLEGFLQRHGSRVHHRDGLSLFALLPPREGVAGSR